MSLNFISCPQCKELIGDTGVTDIHSAIEGFQDKVEIIMSEALKQGEADGKFKDQIEMHKFNNNKLKLALSHYNFYECYNCCVPFISKYPCPNISPENFLCKNCVKPVDNCPKHGGTTIIFKCKFCCSVASFFCWQTTHFCENCHNR